MFGFFWNPHLFQMRAAFDTYHGSLGWIAEMLLVEVIHFSLDITNGLVDNSITSTASESHAQVFVFNYIKLLFLV